jgi:hypothetical protein
LILKSFQINENLRIGRKGSIEWSAQSPDLTLLDFLWDHIIQDVSKIRVLILTSRRIRQFMKFFSITFLRKSITN